MKDKTKKKIQALIVKDKYKERKEILQKLGIANEDLILELVKEIKADMNESKEKFYETGNEAYLYEIIIYLKLYERNISDLKRQYPNIIMSNRCDYSNESSCTPYGNGTISVGTGRLKVHSIFDETPYFMKDADIIVSRPECAADRVRQIYPDFCTPYETYVNSFFQCVDYINPKYLYIEVFSYNRDTFIKECKKRYRYVCVDETYYNRRTQNRCWIIRCGIHREAPAPDIYCSDETYVRWICKNVDCRCIGDICVRRGNAVYHANKVGKKFCGIGTEDSISSMIDILNLGRMK